MKESMNPFTTESAPSKQVPEREFAVVFVRSSGPGGQKVNKTSSKAQLRWNVDASPSFTQEEKALLREKLSARLNRRGEIVISSDEQRSQMQNRENTIRVLQTLVAEALTPEKERVATRPTKGSKEKRLEEKAMRGERKRERRARFEE